MRLLELLWINPLRESLPELVQAVPDSHVRYAPIKTLVMASIAG